MNHSYISFEISDLSQTRYMIKPFTQFFITLKPLFNAVYHLENCRVTSSQISVFIIEEYICFRVYRFKKWYKLLCAESLLEYSGSANNFRELWEVRLFTISVGYSSGYSWGIISQEDIGHRNFNYWNKLVSRHCMRLHLFFQKKAYRGCTVT